MKPKELGWHGLCLSIAFLLAGIHLPTQTYAQPANHDDRWYLGEGAKENMQLKYRIERNETDSSRQYNLTVTFIEHKDNGDWLAAFQIAENMTAIRTDVILGQSDLYPLKVLENSTDLVPYVKDYTQSIQLLGTFTSKRFAHSLHAGDWGGFACEGCPHLRPLTDNAISVPGGIFNATLINYASELNIWVVDEFPYPIKGEFYPSAKLSYTFELLSASVNGVPIPEFEQAFLLLSFASLLTTIVIRLGKGYLKH